MKRVKTYLYVFIHTHTHTHIYIYIYIYIYSCPVAKWLRHYKPEVRGLDSRWCHWCFYWQNPPPRITSNRNEYQEHLLRVKAAGAYGWQPYHFHVPTVLKFGSLSLPEHSGLLCFLYVCIYVCMCVCILYVSMYVWIFTSSPPIHVRMLV